MDRLGPNRVRNSILEDEPNVLEVRGSVLDKEPLKIIPFLPSNEFSSVFGKVCRFDVQF